MLSIPVNPHPIGIYFGDGAVWVLSTRSNTVSRIDPQTGNVTKIISVGTLPLLGAFGDNALWVSNFRDGTVSRIDPNTNAVTATIPVGNQPEGIALSHDAAWVAQQSDGTVSCIALATQTRIATIQVGSSPRFVAADEEGVWVSNNGDGTVSRIDPNTNRVVATIPVGAAPQGIAVGEGSVWVAVNGADIVSRIDPKTNRVIVTIHTGAGPDGIAVEPGAVWVAGDTGPTLWRIDPKTNTVVATIQVADEPTIRDGAIQLTLGGGAAWVTNFNADTVVRVALPDAATDPIVYGLDVNIHDSNIGPANVNRVLQLMHQAGATYVRIGGGWGQAEPERGRFDWSAYDRVIQLAQANQLNVLLEVGGDTPAWDLPSKADTHGGLVDYAPADCTGANYDQKPSFTTFQSVTSASSGSTSTAGPSATTVGYTDPVFYRAESLVLRRLPSASDQGTKAVDESFLAANELLKAGQQPIP